MTFRSLGAWATAGVALWISLGVLDVVEGPSGAVRIAMLPDLAQLAGSVALALLLGVLFELRAAPGSQTADPVVPLYGLAVLLLPYLPWLADGLPILRVFAGPGRYLVWVIVLAQVVWAALGHGGGRRVAAALHVLPASRAFLIVFSATALVLVGASRGLAPSGVLPGGDEPHYLVVTQSLVNDGDLNVDNNYRLRSYSAYYAKQLDIRDATTGSAALPIGLPLMLMPAFWIAGYTGAVLLLSVLAALSAAVVWMWARHVTDSVSAATFAWAATVLSVPVVVGSVTVSPDVPAALLLVLAGACALWNAPLPAAGGPGRAPAMGSWRAVLVGLAAGALPWFHAAYLPAAGVIVGIGVWRCWQTTRTAGGRVLAARVGLIAAPCAASVAGWLTFNFATTGSTWLSPAYLGDPAPFPGLTLAGRHALALLVDQEYGAMSYAPAFAIAVVGLWALWRQRGQARAFALESSLLLAAIVGSAAVVDAWRGGASRPGEFALPALLMAAVPLAYEYRRAAQHPARRAIYRLLLLMGLGASVATLTVGGGGLMASGRDGVSNLIEWLSPDWHLWTYAPDLIAQSAWLGLAQAGIWLAAVLAGTGLVGWISTRGRRPADSRIGRGLAFLRADAGSLLAVLLATSVMPVLIGSWLKPGPDARDRRHIEMLDSFDPHARPIALRMDPFSVVEARTVPSLFELSARPVATAAGQLEGAQFNARFALPAGRYRIQVIGRASLSDEGPLSGRLALRAGTWGGSMIEWRIEGTDSRQWSDAFDLPADMGLVSFATSGMLGKQVRELRIVPYRVVPFLDRIAAEDVRAAAAFDRLLFLFHDEQAYPDATGFWVRGASRARVSVVSRSGLLISDLRLMLHSWVPNSIHIEMPDRVWTEQLAADEERIILIKPTSLDGTVRLVITAERGFYPVDTEPGSTDRRHLGCYVRILE